MNSFKTKYVHIVVINIRWILSTVDKNVKITYRIHLILKKVQVTVLKFFKSLYSDIISKQVLSKFKFSSCAMCIVLNQTYNIDKTQGLNLSITAHLSVHFYYS